MNQCNSPKGSCNEITGQCDCATGYKFADCGVSVTDVGNPGFKTKEYDFTGPGWASLQYSGSKSGKMEMTVDGATSDIYISRGASSDPNNFVYDMSFIGVGVGGTTIIDTDELGLTDGFSVAVYVSAIDEAANKLLTAKATIGFTES